LLLAFLLTDVEQFHFAVVPSRKVRHSPQYPKLSSLLSPFPLVKCQSTIQLSLPFQFLIWLKDAVF